VAKRTCAQANIQQDNTPTHWKVDDTQFCECAKQHGFDIRLIMQPTNSSYFNVLDLGFFGAIQTIQYKKNAKTLKDFILATHQVKDLIAIDYFNTKIS
jgi:hypothetical protein